MAQKQHFHERLDHCITNRAFGPQHRSRLRNLLVAVIRRSLPREFAAAGHPFQKALDLANREARGEFMSDEEVREACRGANRGEAFLMEHLAGEVVRNALCHEGNLERALRYFCRDVGALRCGRNILLEGGFDDHENDAHIALYDCVMGPPNLPSDYGLRVERSWAAWEGGTPLKMAQHAYDARDFSGLPFLADALEEAGAPTALACRKCWGDKKLWVCNNCKAYFPGDIVKAECPQCDYGLTELCYCDLCRGTGVGPSPLLQHLRGPGPHERGCWAVEMILGRG